MIIEQKVHKVSPIVRDTSLHISSLYHSYTINITSNSDNCSISLPIPFTGGFVTVHNSTLILKCKLIAICLALISIITKHSFSTLQWGEYHNLRSILWSRITAGHTAEGDSETRELGWIETPERRQSSPFRITCCTDLSLKSCPLNKVI